MYKILFCLYLFFFNLLDVGNFEFLTWSDPDFIEDSEWGCAGCAFKRGILYRLYREALPTGAKMHCIVILSTYFDRVVSFSSLLHW